MCVFFFLPYISPDISSHTFKVGICLNVYIYVYIQKSLFSIANREKVNALLETFRTFVIFLTKIKFTSSSQEAFSIKIGVPIDKIKATLLKSTTTENFIVNLLRS